MEGKICGRGIVRSSASDGLLVRAVVVILNRYRSVASDFDEENVDQHHRRHVGPRSDLTGVLNFSVPHQRRSTFARRAISVAGPLVWDSLPDYLRDPAVGRDTFCRHLKTFLFAVC